MMQGSCVISVHRSVDWSRDSPRGVHPPTQFFYRYAMAKLSPPGCAEGNRINLGAAHLTLAFPAYTGGADVTEETAFTAELTVDTSNTAGM